MKKVLFMLIWCLSASVVQAQSEHLKFMGIPLDGKINDFQSQLLKKGCTLDELFMKYGKAKGSRTYEGSFAGNNARIVVFFNEKTKKVYRAKAIISAYSEEQVKQKYFEMKSMLMDKYNVQYRLRQEYGKALNDSLIENFRWYVEDTEDKHESTSFMIIDFESFERIGEIDLFVSERESTISYRTEYNLHVDYIDKINNIADQDDRMDDL